MELLKISDPNQRERLVNEYLKNRGQIKQNFLERRITSQGKQQEFQEMFKPVIEAQQEASEAIKQSIDENVRPLKEAAQRHLESNDPVKMIEEAKEKGIDIGLLATEYLSKPRDDQYSLKHSPDRHRGFTLKMNETPVDIEGNDLSIAGKDYTGTPGLWSLLTESKPSRYTQNDYEAYKRILLDTDSIYRRGDPRFPRSNRGTKWESVVKGIWEELKPPQRSRTRTRTTSGSQPLRAPRKSLGPQRQEASSQLPGLDESFSGEGLHSDHSNDLESMIRRFDLLATSRRAGNTGVDKELKQLQKVLKKDHGLDLRYN